MYGSSLVFTLTDTSSVVLSEQQQQQTSASIGVLLLAVHLGLRGSLWRGRRDERNRGWTDEKDPTLAS